MYGRRRLGGSSRNLTLLRARLHRSAALRIISVNSALLERSIPLQAASAERRSSLALGQRCMREAASAVRRSSLARRTSLALGQRTISVQQRSNAVRPRTGDLNQTWDNANSAREGEAADFSRRW